VRVLSITVRREEPGDG
ncbi:bacteriophage replication protein A, partial [Candidatus Erwinia dacicola]